MVAKWYIARLLILTISIVAIVFFISESMKSLKIWNRIGNLKSDSHKPLLRDLYISGFHSSPVDFCSSNDEKFLVLIIIHSLPENLSYRLAIRNTWGHTMNRKIKIIFIVGTSEDSEINQEIADEIQIYNDIIQGKFIETVSSHTFKMMNTLEWIKKYCPQPHFILKSDDDIHINVPLLVKTMETRINDQRAIYGNFVKDMELMRTGKRKHLTFDENFNAQLPSSFSSATVYFFTRDAIEAMYEESLSEHLYTSQETIFITGTIAEKLNLEKIEIIKFYNQLIIFDPCYYSDYSIATRFSKPNEQYELWKKLQTCSNNNIVLAVKNFIYSILN